MAPTVRLAAKKDTKCHMVCHQWLQSAHPWGLGVILSTKQLVQVWVMLTTHPPFPLSIIVFLLPCYESVPSDSNHCSVVPSVDHAGASSMDAVVNSTILLTCDIGHRFPNGQRHRLLQCLESEEWSEDPVPECTGETSAINQPTKQPTNQPTQKTNQPPKNQPTNQISQGAGSLVLFQW